MRASPDVIFYRWILRFEPVFRKPALIGAHRIAQRD
jgi:hypothetical protein